MNTEQKHFRPIKDFRETTPGLWELDGEPVRILGPGEHPITKEKFPVMVERIRDFAIFGLK